MGLISSIVQAFAAPIGAVDPNNEAIWVPTSVSTVLSQAGVAVNSETALRVSCVFHGTRLRAETIAGLPLKLYRETATGGRKLASDHYAWSLLRRRPNAVNTPTQFREMLTAWAILYGVGAARKKPGRNGFAEELIPFDPERLTIKRANEESERVFEYTKADGTRNTYLQDEVFAVDGFSLAPLVGASVLRLAREAIGLWLARERFAGLYFSQGVNPSLALETPKKLSPEALEQYREQEQQLHGNGRTAHKTFLATEGAKVVQITQRSARDAQLSETVQQIVLDHSRWLNVPHHMMQSGLQPTYGSAFQMAQEFVDYGVKPDAKRWQGSIVRDLLIDGVDDNVYVEHLFEELLKGDTKSRYDAYGVAVTNGWMTRNEVRERENLEPLDGLDEPLTPLNMSRTTGSTPADQPTNATAPQPPLEATEKPPAPEQFTATLENTTPRRFVLIAESAAKSIVAKEVAHLAHLSTKLAGKPDTWRAAVASFYRDHAQLVAERLQLEPAVARAYCDRQRNDVIAQGVAALETFHETAVPHLTQLALEEIPHDRAA